jgi:hypothetical protein
MIFAGEVSDCLAVVGSCSVLLGAGNRRGEVFTDRAGGCRRKAVGSKRSFWSLKAESVPFISRGREKGKGDYRFSEAALTLFLSKQSSPVSDEPGILSSTHGRGRCTALLWRKTMRIIRLGVSISWRLASNGHLRSVVLRRSLTAGTNRQP